MSGHGKAIVRVRGGAPEKVGAKWLRDEAEFLAGRVFPGRDVEVSVLFCGDARMRVLNRDYRGKACTTDVLSFTMGEEAEGRLQAGDVVISRDRARRDAVRDGMTIREKVTELLAHGLLHLAGHDHETDADARRMDRKWRALRAARDKERYP